jgi:hypothetical protein
VKTPPRIVALATLPLAAVACSQKDPAQEAIDAGRKAFDEERYADAIAAVKDVPAHAEALSKG